MIDVILSLIAGIVIGFTGAQIFYGDVAARVRREGMTDKDYPGKHGYDGENEFPR